MLRRIGQREDRRRPKVLVSLLWQMLDVNNDSKLAKDSQKLLGTAMQYLQTESSVQVLLGGFARLLCWRYHLLVLLLAH
jgi:hypothetical protein